MAVHFLHTHIILSFNLIKFVSFYTNILTIIHLFNQCLLFINYRSINNLLDSIIINKLKKMSKTFFIPYYK